MSHTVLITGTSSGMGEELVRQFSRRGWDVAATVRTWASRTDAHELPGVRTWEMDVTDPASVQRVVDGVLAAHGTIDVLVANAGYAELGALEEVPVERWRAQYETNVFGVVTTVQAVLPSMRTRRAGHIIIVASMGGHVSLPTMTAYTSSKFAVEGLAEGLAKEVAPLGIHVTIAEPAGYGTAFSANAAAPQSLIDDYVPARAAMASFSAGSVRGDLAKSMSALADVAGTAAPPSRLALGSYGLVMVRRKMAELSAAYDAWEPVTATTD
jgi:NAD(P)-dependent dehydrogenase (short-subunit alcohol dehydrogenase family)